MYSTSLQIIVFMWQYEFVDTLSAIKIIYNSGLQYGAIVIDAMAETNATHFPRAFIEPIAGFGVSYKFVKAA